MTPEEMLKLAAHFVIDKKTESGRAGDDMKFRIVRFGTPARGGLAELMTLLLGRDGHWHDRPHNEENAEFSHLTGFDTAEEAFAALANEKSEPGFLATFRATFDCDPLDDTDDNDDNDLRPTLS